MTEPLPVVLVPGLLASIRLYGEQLPVLWRLGPVTIADHTPDASMAAIASRILAAGPPSFALVGLSMGGYIAFEILRQAPDRMARLALLDTTGRPDTPNRPSGARPRSRWPAADASPSTRPALPRPDPPQPPRTTWSWGGWCA
jgi:pimeloyl-ACP methyl ester carboxylesterase